MRTLSRIVLVSDILSVVNILRHGGFLQLHGQSCNLLLLSFELADHLNDNGFAIVVGVHARPLEELSLGELVFRESAVLQGCFRCIHTFRVVHLVSVQEILHDVRRKQNFLIFVDFCHVGVLPLEANLLLGSIVSVLLDRLEDPRSQLGFKSAQRSLLFERLNNYAFQIVHNNY